MNGLLKWFSVERTTGLIMLVTCVLLFLRPYASAIEVFEDAGLIRITLSLLRVAILVGAAYLIWRRVVGRAAFIICLMPMMIYAIALLIVFLFIYNIGPFGSVYGIGYCGLSIYIQSLRDKSAPPETPTETKT